MKGVSRFFQSSGLVGAGSTAAEAGDGLIGTSVEVNHERFVLRQKIGSGGFADVYSAQDKAGQWYAIKFIRTHDAASKRDATNEAKFCAALSGHSAMMKYVGAAQREIANGRGTEVVLVTELCSGGSVCELLQQGPLSREQILRIIYAAASGVRHMHMQSPPITNRDVKIENLLIDSNGYVKFCDFGSSTTEYHQPTDDWPSSKRTLIEEEYAKHTTPMYRPPEILETYNNYPIGPAIDIWALGCVLHYLCYRVHPFEDSSKLRIMGAKVINTKDPSLKTNEVFQDLINSCLSIDPCCRPTATDLVERIEAFAAAYGINAKAPLTGISSSLLLPSTTPARSPPNSRRQQPSLSSKSAEESATAFFSALKGGVKVLKERTHAVVSTVQNTYGSKGPALVMVTSRLLLAPCLEGVPEPLAHSAEESLKSHLTDARRPFLLVNLSARSLRCEYAVSPVQFIMHPPCTSAPSSLEGLLSTSQQIALFLSKDNAGVVVLHGVEENCFFMAALLLIYLGVCARSYETFELLERTKSLGKLPQLPASYHAHLDTVAVFAHGNCDEIAQKLSQKSIIIRSLTLRPIPIANRALTGCRPVIELYETGRKVFQSSRQYFETTEFLQDNGYAKIELGPTVVCGEVAVVVSHARKTMDGGLSLIQLFSIQFHTHFLDGETKSIVFNKTMIDASTDFQEDVMNATLLFSYDADGQPLSSVIRRKCDASDRALFSSETEYREITSALGERGSPPSLPEIPGYIKLGVGSSKTARRPPPRPPAAKGHGADFFSSMFEAPQEEAPPHSTVPSRPPPPVRDLLSSNAPPQEKDKIDEAEMYERMAGIRVSQQDLSDDEPLFGSSSKNAAPTQRPEEFDLLGLHSTEPIQQSTSHVTSTADPFDNFFGASQPKPQTSQPDLFDLITEPTVPPSNIHRNVSAPTFVQAAPQSTAKAFDPFADFLTSAPASNPASEANSGRNTPQQTQKPNYSRSVFETSQSKKPSSANAFDDLLSAHNFVPSPKTNRTMGDLRREEEIKNMDPVSIKIRDWTAGKEGNIRALLGSMQEVLWDGVEWSPPTMASLLTVNDVKKCYRRACLIVHPDKQAGKPHEELAKAISCELNLAWNAFEAEKMTG